MRVRHRFYGDPAASRERYKAKQDAHRGWSKRAWGRECWNSIKGIALLLLVGFAGLIGVAFKGRDDA